MTSLGDLWRLVGTQPRNLAGATIARRSSEPRTRQWLVPGLRPWPLIPPGLRPWAQTLTTKPPTRLPTKPPTRPPTRPQTMGSTSDHQASHQGSDPGLRPWPLASEPDQAIVGPWPQTLGNSPTSLTLALSVYATSALVPGYVALVHGHALWPCFSCSPHDGTARHIHHGMAHLPWGP